MPDGRMNGRNPVIASSAGADRNDRLARLVREELTPVRLRFRLLNAALFFLPHFSLNRIRTSLYRLVGVNIGARTLVLGSMEMAGRGRYWQRLKIGTDCQVTAPLYLDLNESITVGNHVAIGHHVVLITTTHEIGPSRHRCGRPIFKPIIIEDGAWIGAGATILPGVTIGRGSVVAAGATVTKDVAPNALVGGVPAKLIRELDPE